MKAEDYIEHQIAVHCDEPEQQTVEDVWETLLKGYYMCLNGHSYDLCKLVESIGMSDLQEAVLKHTDGDQKAVVQLLKKQIEYLLNK